MNTRWLNLPEAAAYCGFGETAFRELIVQPDFPRPSNPTGSPKGRRWSTQWLDDWMASRREAA